MRKLFYLLFIQFLFLQTTVYGQVFFTVELQEDNVTYLIKLRPETSYTAPLNTTNNAQLSFVVPTGGFKAGNIKNVKGTWLNDNNVVAPEENPANDYLVFNLSGNIADIDYVAGQEVELFSFENVGECTGTLDFITQEDPFFFNSKNINIGNQISVLGAGFINAFSGSYGPAANCQESQNAFTKCILVDSIITTNPTQCGLEGGTITIHATVDNGLPLRYSIDDGKNFQTDSVFTGLESAKNYVIIVRDEFAFCFEEFGVIELGPATDAVIIRTISTPDTCMQANGTILIEATAIIEGTILEYSIDEGQNWFANDGFFTNVPAGTYRPRVRAKDAPCFEELEEIVVAADCPDNGGGGDPPTTGGCVYSYILEAQDGKFIVSVLSDTTITVPQNTTATAQVTIKVPTGNFQVANFENLLDGVQFTENGRSTAPSEASNFDYIVFGLTTLGTRNIQYTKGVKIPLFSFENGGECTGNQVFLMENFTDPFYPPNSEDANVGQQITVALTGSDLSIICNQSNEISDCGEDLNDMGNNPINYPTDTIYLTLPIDETTTVCIEDELDIASDNIGTVALCNSGGTVMTALTDGSNCFDITTDDHFNQTETLCIVHNQEDDATLSDTTIFILCPKVSLGDDLSICTGATIQLNPTGGTGNFTWITDGNISCTDCPNPEITPDATTEYILLSMDGAHCKDTDTINVQVKDAPGSINVVTTAPTDCQDNGAITVTANEGQGPFKYSIDNGVTFQDSPQFDNLAAGNYDIVVANQNETCFAGLPESTNLVAGGAPVIDKLSTQAPNECTNEKGAITVVGTITTNETLEYSIDGGDTWQLDTVFADLEAGDYSVQVRIQNSNCTTTFANNPVQLVEQSAIQFTSTPGDRTICSEEGRTILLEGSENISDFTITGGDFEDAVIDGTTLTFMANPMGESTIYTVALIGESGCTVMEDFTLTMAGENTDNWTIDIATTPASCDDRDGSISVTVNENNNGFTFCWEPNKASGPSRENLHSDSTYSLTITGSSGCTVVREDLMVGTTCDIPTCAIFTGLDTLNAFVVDNKATACIPIPNMDLNELQFYENDQLIDGDRFGECMQTSQVYDYGMLIGLGGAPYRLINWSVNQDTLKDFEFDTFEELVTRMNQFDFQANWVLQADRQFIQGFSTANTYGSLEIQPNGSSEIPQLQLTPITTMFQSLTLEATRGIKRFTVKDPLNDCEDEIFIKVQGLNDGMDTLELITLVNTPIRDQCLNTEETGTENLAIQVCNSPSAGTLTLTGSSDNCFGYVPNSDFIGKDFFCLELCNGTICDTTVVTVTVTEEGLFFHTGFSPNGDGVNDLFTIRNIENYPDNSLTIYNRWGNSIFKTKPNQGYTNEEGWNGTFDGKLTPDGVYFYLLKVKINEEDQLFSGPLTISR